MRPRAPADASGCSGAAADARVASHRFHTSGQSSVPASRRVAAVTASHARPVSDAGWRRPPLALPSCPPSAAVPVPAPSSSCAPPTPPTSSALRCCGIPCPAPLPSALPDSLSRSSPHPRPWRSARPLHTPSPGRSPYRPVGRLQRDRHHRSAAEVHRLLHLVRQVRAPIFHLGDARVGIVRVLPLLIRPLARTLPVQPRQLLPRRRRNP